MSPQSTSIARSQPLDTLQLLIKTTFYNRSAIVDNIYVNENLHYIFIFIAFCLGNLWSFGYFQLSEAMCLQIFDHKELDHSILKILYRCLQCGHVISNLHNPNMLF